MVFFANAVVFYLLNPAYHFALKIRFSLKLLLRYYKTFGLTAANDICICVGL